MIKWAIIGLAMAIRLTGERTIYEVMLIYFTWRDKLDAIVLS